MLQGTMPFHCSYLTLGCLFAGLQSSVRRCFKCSACWVTLSRVATLPLLRSEARRVWYRRLTRKLLLCVSRFQIASFMFPVAGSHGPSQGMMPMQQQQQQQPGYPMVQVMQPNMQSMMGLNFGSQMPPGTMPMQGGMPMGPMQAAGMQYMGQPQFMGMTAPGPQYMPDMQKQLAEEHQKRLEHQQRMLEEDRKRRQFEEQKQKLRLLSSVKPKMGEKSRDDALEAIKGNLDGFSRDAKMHPTPASHPKKPDMPPSHSTASSSSLLSQPPAFPEDDDDDFSDFMQGPVEPMSSVTSTTSSSSSFQPSSPRVQGPHSSEQAAVPSHPAPPPQAPLPPVPLGSAGHHPSVSTSTTSSQASALKGPSLEEKLVSSCDLRASKQAQVHFKSSQPLAEMGHKAPVSAHFQPSTKARNWGIADSNLRAVFTVEAPPPPPQPASTPAKAPPPANETDLTVEESGVGVYPQQEAIQPMVPGWLYNDGLVPDLFKKVLEITMTPSGIDTAKLYPILMSSGLPREALGQIWASANRTTPGKLTKEELYTVLAMIGVTQRGLPAMSLDILTQFPSAPVPNLPGLALVMPGVMQQQQHQQQPMLSMPPVPQPAVSMPLSTAQPVLGVNLPVQAGALSTQVSPGFMPSFPSNTQASEPDDDDFQDFQEAPKAGSANDSFTDFQGESSGAFPIAARTQPQNSALALLTPISGSSTPASSDKYAVFKQLSVERPGETAVPVPDYGDKYSVFRALEQPPDIKPIGEGFADFKSAGGDDGFTDFKTADSISPLDPPEQAKIFQQTFPPPFLQTQPLQQQPQPHNSTATLPPSKPSLNMADLDLFSSLGGPAASTTAETKPLSFPAPSTLASSLPPSSGAGRKALGGADDFGDFALFGSSSLGVSAPSAGAAHVQDDFADFMAFGSASSSGVPEQKTAEEKPSENNSSVGETPLQQQQQQKSSDKYDIFKRLSLEGSTTPLGFEDAKESLSAGLASASSVVKGDPDDFADFQSSSRFSSALGSSEKSLVDKVAAFKQAKEDSASVKSLDLPSIGGSSAGKEDSEDALSVQLDMKLSDLGGDLQHVLSDSSLDLPVVSGHQPPAAEVDDFKFDPFGTFSAGDSAVSSLASFDWSEREEPATNQSKKPQPSFFTSEGSHASATSVLQKKETSFGSAENVAVTTSGKVSAFTREETSSASTAEGQFDTFADFGTKGQGEEEEEEEDDDFGDFASTVSEKSDTAPVSGDLGSDTTQPDDFGASQADKPKFGKFDFLMASSQAKVKSSEEMIRSELATFDLSVQGSHKRSLSLGDKEISHSTPSPAPEQPFRDKSNTLSEKPALPVIRDKYKDLTGEVEESERYAYEWQRCLESALQVINKANDTLNGISSSSVCTEVIQSAQGMEYLLGVVEVYRVVRRVELGIKATAVCSDKLQQLLKDINRVWHNLIGFMSLANLSPDESSLDFSSCILRHGIKNAKELACGVCLLSVDSRSKTSGLPLFTLVLNALQKEDKAKERPPKNAFSSETDSFKLMYGGHQYHASCANFWINCVEPKPPGLILPDLL
ncbi:synergin gamma-like isoform X2 [Acipenser ruthenus]|uniref:synergin gamma-like isoform X2 n=1 Tax=Acipenser ruthenus TaxID=7906 RepID=UPI002741F709|nr:synergin gamma-like isoform X2 [Acipenser ruthenus]